MDMIKYKLSYEIYIYLFKEIILRESTVFFESVCLLGGFLLPLNYLNE